MKCKKCKELQESLKGIYFGSPPKCRNHDVTDSDNNLVGDYIDNLDTDNTS